MMHVPYHHPRGRKLPVCDHRHPVRSARFPAYSVHSHPVRRRPLCIVLPLRDTRLLPRRGHQGIKMSSQVTIAIARTPLGTRIKVCIKPNRERVDLVVLCSKRQGVRSPNSTSLHTCTVVLCRKRQGVRSPQWTMVYNGLGPGSNITPSSSCAEGNDAAVKASKCRPEFQWLEHRYWNGE